MQKEKSNKNLKTGTHYMTEIEKNFLSGKEICTIIETCAKKGVGEFSYGPLSFNFGNRLAPQPARNGPQKPENVIQEQQNIEKETLLTEELRTKDDQIAELMITNPLLAEELMIEGELEDSDEDDTDDA